MAENTLFMLVTLDVSQPPTYLSKAAVSEKIESMFVTLDVFQLPVSWLKAAVAENIPSSKSCLLRLQKTFLIRGLKKRLDLTASGGSQ